MRANIETTQNPVARPATAERLRVRLECNGGVVLAEAVVVVVVVIVVIVLAKKVVLSGDGTFVSWDGLNVEGVMAKVLELEDESLIIKARLLSLLSIKPGGLPVEVSSPVGSSS